MKNNNLKILVICLFILMVSIFHFTSGVTGDNQHIYHVVFRTLYLIPIIAGAIWFRLTGALLVSSTISAVYASHILVTWQGQTMENTNQWAMVGVYLILGVVSGILSKLEHAQKVARLQAEWNKQREATITALESLSVALKWRDAYTQKHSENVASLSEALGNYLELPTHRVVALKLAARIHDIGKIGIKDDVLFKKEKLTSEDRRIIEQHPLVAANILRPIAGASFIADIVSAHHENLDGTGYPQGLTVEQIPYEALILSVADAYSALTEDRPYHLGLESSQAIQVLEEQKGTRYHPEVVDALKYLLNNPAPKTT